MWRSGLAIRIIGLAATTRGFSFAVAEGPENLVDWGGYKISSQERLLDRLDEVVRRARPLFVACEVARNCRRSERGRQFNEALKAVCTRHGLMILCVERKRVGRSKRNGDATNYEIAVAVAERFPVLARRLPNRPRLWENVNERLGVFLAAGAAVAGWAHFRRRD